MQNLMRNLTILLATSACLLVPSASALPLGLDAAIDADARVDAKVDASGAYDAVDAIRAQAEDLKADAEARAQATAQDAQARAEASASAGANMGERAAGKLYEAFQGAKSFAASVRATISVNFAAVLG